MIYSLVRGARRRRVSKSSMQRSLTPPPDSKRTRTTKPPGPADDGARNWEVLAELEGETEARLQNIARVYGLTAVK